LYHRHIFLEYKVNTAGLELKMSQPLQQKYRAGAYAPVLTPFKLGARETVNLELFAVMVARLAEAGVGLIVGGMDNEAHLLSADERITLVRQARETVNSLQLTKPVPILAAILGSDLHEYAQMAQAAAAAGADAMYRNAPLPSFPFSTRRIAELIRLQMLVLLLLPFVSRTRKNTTQSL
jgi:hypothetical protein